MRWRRRCVGVGVTIRAGSCSTWRSPWPTGATVSPTFRSLRDQPALFGAVASTPTASRVVDSVDAERLGAMRAAHAGAAAGLGCRAVPGAQDRAAHPRLRRHLGRGPFEKTGAGPTYKGGYGVSPLACFLDATNEALALLLRAGNRAPHNADDHVEVLDLALAQLPVSPLGLDPDNGVAMLARTDSAGASHQFVDALVERGIEFSIGFEMRKAVRLAIVALPKAAWTEAITADCEIRDGAEVAELTNLDLSLWPVGTRAIVRREEPHNGAQFNLFDPNGWRHQVFITNSTDADIAYLEARHRGHARIEDRIRCAKDTGLRNLPFGDFANNACWVELICLAQDLIAFTQGLVLEGELAKVEPKRLRYSLCIRRGGSAPPHARRRWLSSTNGPGPPHWLMLSPSFARCH